MVVDITVCGRPGCRHHGLWLSWPELKQSLCPIRCSVTEVIMICHIAISGTTVCDNFYNYLRKQALSINIFKQRLENFPFCWVRTATLNSTWWTCSALHCALCKFIVKLNSISNIITNMKWRASLLFWCDCTAYYSSFSSRVRTIVPSYYHIGR